VDKGLKLAIEAAGSGRRLAAKLGLSQQAVQQWRRIPAERVIEVERITLVPRERFRPDLHPPRPDGLK
jgi:DNA-binding transcriptional regulator YdaS (Cro superfamily)